MKKKEIWKQVKAGAGFTLVELIVVIAILGILAGVGTMAYTGYINATNKGVDRQTVGELIYAATLADYANPSLFGTDGSAMIAVSADGTRSAGSYNADAFRTALEDSMGNLANVKLQYSKWGGAVDGATLNSMVQSLQTVGYTDGSGNILVKDADGNTLTASYAANADEMWERVADVAKQMEEQNTVTNAAEYLAKAADYTTQTSAINTGATMGSAWASADLGHAITGEQAATPESLGALLAAEMARNHAFVEYLKVNNYEVSDAVCAAIQSAGDDEVLQFYQNVSPTTGESLVTAECWSTLHDAAQAYLNGGANSQAYADGMIYYALMYNIDTKTKDGTFDTSSDTYLDDISGYVSVAGKAFSGTVDWGSMVNMANTLDGAGTTVVIYVTKNGNKLNFSVSPTDADPRDGSEDGGSDAPEYTSTVTLTLDTTAKSLTCGTQNIVISTESGNNTCRLNLVNQDGTTQAVTGLEVTVSDSSVATYENGVITAAGKGTATMTIKSTSRGNPTVTIGITVR